MSMATIDLETQYGTSIFPCHIQLPLGPATQALVWNRLQRGMEVANKAPFHDRHTSIPPPAARNPFETIGPLTPLTDFIVLLGNNSRMQFFACGLGDCVPNAEHILERLSLGAPCGLLRKGIDDLPLRCRECGPNNRTASPGIQSRHP